MNYQETLSFLFSRLPAYQRIGRAAYKEGLGNTIALDNYFANPHTKFRTVHVAGTNGKGSVSHMLASVFQTMGLKTGLYTSPHLRDFRERIRIDGIMLPETEVTGFVENHKAIIEAVSPSFFEMTVAMAFDYFARESVDIAVIEVGMGGRLDSTNIITPVLSVITNIGHDHMEFLGETLAKVAAEKGGIIKPGVPVVVGESLPETRPVFEQIASDNGSVLKFADEYYTCRLGRSEASSAIRGYVLLAKSDGYRTEGLIPLTGDYQARNLATLALAAGMMPAGYTPSVNQLADGIEQVVKLTGLQGRWQVLRHDPLVIADTGHNREGIEYVVRQLSTTPHSRLHMVIGMVNDKDLATVLPLLPRDAFYYFTKASIPRALDEKRLKEEASYYGLSGEA
ncbi:MAG: bifunctional folylpolyglutamate synthase/dihydrofolate synthase, partial [Bacteroidetes bacterium]|nr:bifunctional folylpolyglutamate synthase/dihydrofolate synthase [Bacteroidota bacterium]